MLGLPSTTEVDKRLPKEVFYHNLKLAPKVKDSFVHDIERITVRNSIKPSTTNLPTGDKVPEIIVVELELKSKNVPEDALRAIAGANPHKLVFACTYEGEGCLAVLVKRMIVGQWQSVDSLVLSLKSKDMDAVWDSMASQVVYEDEGEEDASIERRIELDDMISAMKKEIAALESRCRREKQFAKKNDLFNKIKRARAELENIQANGQSFK